MNNQITLTQWNELMSAVLTNFSVSNQPEGAIYSGVDRIDNDMINKRRFFCYDNYDRHDVPGFDLIIKNNSLMGTLTVYNSSEQARAPITFEDGLNIAHNFFNEEGYDMSEEIVCDWIMNGNDSIF
jgi:hypothetical protein